MINVPLLESTMGRIFAEPENWNQREWVTTDPVYLPPGNVCGTAMCFAGHAAILDGAQLASSPSNTVVTRDGERWPVASYATLALGLTSRQADDLFRAENSLDDLQYKVKDLIEQAQQ